MASLSILSSSSSSTLSLRLLPSPQARLPSTGSTQLTFLKRDTTPVRLSSGLSFPFGTTTTTTTTTTTHRLRSLTVFAAKARAKGYKMKTHKASAKRFRVTGKGKIVRRCAGKQHLLGKKNTKRKKRLSKMTPVNRSDYDNVIGALPYLKVNRKAT